MVHLRKWGRAGIKSVTFSHSCFIIPTEIWTDIHPPVLGSISNLLGLISATFSFIKYRLLGYLELPVDIFFRLTQTCVGFSKRVKEGPDVFGWT